MIATMTTPVKKRVSELGFCFKAIKNIALTCELFRLRIPCCPYQGQSRWIDWQHASCKQALKLIAPVPSANYLTFATVVSGHFSILSLSPIYHCIWPPNAFIRHLMYFHLPLRVQVHPACHLADWAWTHGNKVWRYCKPRMTDIRRDAVLRTIVYFLFPFPFLLRLLPVCLR